VLHGLGPLACSETMNPFVQFGGTPWMWDWPIARSVPTQDSTIQKYANVYRCLERDWNPRPRSSNGSKQSLIMHLIIVVSLIKNWLHDAGFFSRSRPLPSYWSNNQFLWNPKVHKSPPLDLLLWQSNLVDTPSISVRYILILSFHLCSGLASNSFLKRFRHKIQYAFLMSLSSYQS